MCIRDRRSIPSITSTTNRARCFSGSHSSTDGGRRNPVWRSIVRKLFIGATFVAIENHRTDSIPNDSYPVKSDRLLALRLHAIDMFRTRESAGAHVGGIALDRGLDHRAEIAVAANELRYPRRQPQHIFQHQYLTVAGRAGADPDGGYGDGLGDLPRQWLCDRLDHDRECAGLR